MSSKVNKGVGNNGLTITIKGRQYYATNISYTGEECYAVYSDDGLEIITDDLEKIANTMRDIAPLTKWRFIKDGE